MALTGQQVKQLRSLAHHLDPIVTVGKSGVTETVVEQLNECLEAHELVKCNVLESSGMSAREAANALSEQANAEVVQVIGRRFTVYRETSRKDVEKIKLVF